MRSSGPTSRTRALERQLGAASHRGKVRSENQDRHGVFPTRLGEVCAVADGMGGHLDGSRAAEIVIEVLERELGSLGPRHGEAAALRDSASTASAEVYRQSADSAAAGSRMGATLVMALVRDGRAWIGHAGDSRAYLLRAGQLRPLTRDHTVVERMVEKGILSPGEARDHPDSGIVLRALGKGEEVDLEVSAPLGLLPGDRLMLCSDGLCGYVDDERIEELLGRGHEAREVAGSLVEAGLEAGGEDNVTVQVILFRNASPSRRSAGAAAGEAADARLDPFGGRGRGAWLGLGAAVGFAALWVVLMLWLTA